MARKHWQHKVKRSVGDNIAFYYCSNKLSNFEGNLLQTNFCFLKNKRERMSETLSVFFKLLTELDLNSIN